MAELLSHPTQWVALPLVVVFGAWFVALLVKDQRERWR